MGALMIGFLLLPGRGEREREKNKQVSLFCPQCDELHDIEKLFIEYAWVFYTKAARDAAQRATCAVDSSAHSTIGGSI